MFISHTSVHAVSFHCSTEFTTPPGASPPATIPAVADPHPAKEPLAVLISLTSVQLEPSNSSTTATPYPATHKAAVCTPNPTVLGLVVEVRSPTSVQLVPS